MCVGLDSAVTADIMRMNANISAFIHKTLIISLLQPPPDALKVIAQNIAIYITHAQHVCYIFL